MFGVEEHSCERRYTWPGWEESFGEQQMLPVLKVITFALNIELNDIG